MTEIENFKSTESWNPADVRMSFFKKPIRNKVPEREPLTLFQVYELVRGRAYLPETEALRLINSHEEQRKYKGEHFDYVTPSGTFTYCADTALVRHSGVICMDLDDLGDRVEELFQKLLADPCFLTLLLFRSPSGNGLKWFIPVDLSRCDHRSWYQAVRRYLMATYHLDEKQVDPMCCNPSRACYLGHDPHAYLLLSLIENF